MTKEKSILKITLFTLLIPLGIFMFVFGGYDDSPGAQLIGLIIIVIGIIGIVKTKKRAANPQK